MTYHRIQVGSVVQIIEMSETHVGWVGAFVLVTEVKSWGVQGFVHMIDTHAQSSSAYTRLTWDQIAYIGEAEIVPTASETADA